MRDYSHQETGRLIAKDGATGVILLVRTVKPTITPSGKIVYADWLYKKGGSGFAGRSWRKRWFVVRDDCIAYYYPSAEVSLRERERVGGVWACYNSHTVPSCYCANQQVC